MLTRRTLLKGFVAGAAGLLLPSQEIVAGEEATRRYWALDRTMRTDPNVLPMWSGPLGLSPYDVLIVDGEFVWVSKIIDEQTIRVVRNFPWIDGDPFGDARPLDGLTLRLE